ncbi:hypothetical protein GCM10009599_03600 [Luteococcus peritonei]
MLLSALLVLALALAAAGFGYYRHLNGNLTTVDMPGDVGGTAATLEGLPKGSAQNILVTGTDSRQDADDCKLGGSCGKAKIDGETNADVQMVVHISADQTSMAVVSIPRDTVVDLPACAGNGKTREAGRGMVNSSLNYGTDCSIKTVHQLTGLPITHFAMVDFSGVVTLSEAIGGVKVCVDNDVYDPQSHLKLAKGEHLVEGAAALQFLRTRHGFGDGSDLGRTVAQHLFLASLQRSLESKGTLLNPAKVYRLAEAATEALTVDKGLASVATLAQLATTAGSIPASATSFVTMPTVPDPADANRVVPAESAKTLFQKLAADQPLVTPKPSAKASAPASSAPASSASPTASTQESSGAASSSTPSASTSTDAAHDGSAQLSSDATGCAPVSQQLTVELNGQAMTPTRAYQLSPGIPDSDA